MGERERERESESTLEADAHGEDGGAEEGGGEVAGDPQGDNYADDLMREAVCPLERDDQSDDADVLVVLPRQETGPVTRRSRTAW